MLNYQGCVADSELRGRSCEARGEGYEETSPGMAARYGCAISGLPFARGCELWRVQIWAARNRKTCRLWVRYLDDSCVCECQYAAHDG